MKASYFLLAAAIFSAGKTLAQRKENVKDVPIAISVFDKGTLSFTNKTNLNYTNFTSRINGDPKDFSFQVDPSYFFAKGIAVGIEARTGSNSSKSTSSSFSSWQTNLTATYGRSITDNLNAYIKVFAGPGGSNSEFTNGTAQKLKSTYFELKGMIGLPIALESKSAAFFTPYISYDYYKTNADVNDFKEKAFTIGFRLESYIGKGQMVKGNEDLAKGAYLQGSHFLEFTTAGSLSFNNRQQYQMGSSTTFAKQKNNSTYLAFGYHYYFMDNLAAGLNFSVNSRKSFYQGASGSTVKNSTLMITPVITAQAPLEGAGHNLFLQASYGFGVYKDPKKNLTDLSIKAGYNLFLAKYLTLTPKIGYEQAKGNVPSGVSGIPYVNSGFAAELGVRSWLNFWKWKK